MADSAPIDWRALRTFAVVAFIARLALLVVAHPFMDETYYWLWGQHPALSYFDHPSLAGWSAWLASLFGWNVIALRLPVVLTLVGDLVLLALLAQRLYGDQWRQSFWTTAAIFLTAPIFILLTGAALPDHLLVFFSLLTVYAVESFRSTDEAGTPRWRFLYLAGLAIGLAMLSKYTGALLGVGLIAYLASSVALRRTLRSPHLYLAVLLALALQTPVLIWNIQHGFASFAFVVGGRSGVHNPLTFSGVVGYVLGAVAVLSPFLLWAMLRFATARGDGHGFSRIVFWLSTVVFLVASFVTNILFHWNAVAYVATMPLLLPLLRPRWLVIAQLVYGAIAIVVAAVNFGLLPVTALVAPADRSSGWSYGWDDVAAAVTQLRATRPVDFVAAPNYALASPLGFALHDSSVTSLSPRREAFDDWFDPAAHRGQNALIVGDRFYPVDPALQADFATLTKLQTVDIVRFGRPVESFTIYLGTGFQPQ